MKQYFRKEARSTKIGFIFVLLVVIWNAFFLGFSLNDFLESVEGLWKPFTSAIRLTVSVPCLIKLGKISLWYAGAEKEMQKMDEQMEFLNKLGESFYKENL